LTVQQNSKTWKIGAGTAKYRL